MGYWIDKNFLLSLNSYYLKWEKIFLIKKTMKLPKKE